MKNRPKIVGIDPRAHTDYALIKDAGIEWVRLEFPFPFDNPEHTQLSNEFIACLEQAKSFKKQDLSVMGITPSAGVMEYDASLKVNTWKRRIPPWAGSFDEERYYSVTEAGCLEIAKRTQGLVDRWQIANEMDISIFRGTMTVEQATHFLIVEAKGIKNANPSIRTSINPSHLSEDALSFFQTLYTEPYKKLFDDAGTDAYFGSWQAGTPDEWVKTIDTIYEITKVPVLIHEWGYASIGGTAKPGKRSVCEEGGFPHVWQKEHSEQEQAEYISQVLQIFAYHPHVLGSFLFQWGDTDTCYHCGKPDCPAECGWGLVNRYGQPKKAYAAFKAAIQTYYK